MKTIKNDIKDTFFINYQLVDEDKIIMLKKVAKASHQNILFRYNLDKPDTKILHFITDFIDVAVNLYSWSHRHFNSRYITIDPNHHSAIHLLDIFYGLDKCADNYMKINYPQYTIWKKICNRTNKKTLDHLKLHFLVNKVGSIKTEIYNYNVSKKYPPFEHFKCCRLDDIKRFLRGKKQIRFILLPVLWINHFAKSYGIKIYIKCMEVRFPVISTKFKSKLDENSVIVREEIECIEI